MKRYPMKLIAPLKDYLWGGTRLKDEYGKKTDLDIVAESWELACHKDGKSVIANGEASGMTLEAWLAEQKDDMLGAHVAKFPYFPLLIKLIDARGNLSVQVHPDNEYAQRVEGEYGKTEMWYIVDCEPGATLIYGFKHAISKEEFEKRIADNTLLEVCNQVPVHKGDVFFIASGTLHAIGKGIIICEIQQNSNTTYRVYDYGRLGLDGKPRQLHTELAKDAIDYKVYPEYRTDYQPVKNKEVEVVSCKYFTTSVYQLDAPLTKDLSSIDSFMVVMCVAGSGSLSCHSERSEESLPIRQGETVLIPASATGVTFTPSAEGLTLVTSYIK